MSAVHPAGIIGRVRRLAQLIQLQSDSVLMSCGISRAEIDILALLTRTGRPLTPSELASRRPRGIHQDDREGSGIINTVLRSVSDFEEQLISFMSAEDRTELIRLLRNLLTRIEAATP